jgi:hypothetical protein
MRLLPGAGHGACFRMEAVAGPVKRSYFCKSR